MPTERMWIDATGRQWFLCDVCHGAVEGKGVFTAWVAPDLTETAGAFYCRIHATELISNWALRLADQPPPHQEEECWCGDPNCGVEA